MKSFATVATTLALTGAAVALPGGGNHQHTTVTVGPSEPVPTQTGCPTVTATGELCASCPIPACLVISTITQSCDCPAAIPTVTLDFPCKDNCKGLFCTTSYETVAEVCEPTETETCTDLPTPTDEPSETCTDDEPQPTETCDDDEPTEPTESCPDEPAEPTETDGPDPTLCKGNCTGQPTRTGTKGPEPTGERPPTVNAAAGAFGSVWSVGWLALGALFL